MSGEPVAALAERLVQRFTGRAVPTLLPYALADAVAVLVARGDDGDALAARMAAPELRVFVRTAATYAARSGEPPPSAFWLELGRDLAALGSDLARQRVMRWCEPFAARLDAARCLDVWTTALDEATLVARDAAGEDLAVRLQLDRPDLPAWPARPSALFTATLACARAGAGDADRDELARWLVAELERGSEVAADTQGRLLTALALVDPERAHRLYLADLSWSSRGTIADAFGVLAPWIARTKGRAHLVEWILGMRYHVAASEWLAEAAVARALGPADVEPAALELAQRIETWLDPHSWAHAIAPLARSAGAIGSVAVVDALCHRYVPEGDRVADALSGGLAELAHADAGAAARFVDALEASAPFAESFDPPDDLLPAPWEAVPPAWRAVLTEPSRAELRAAAMDVVRVASATPLAPSIWHPLGEILAGAR